MKSATILIEELWKSKFFEKTLNLEDVNKEGWDRYKCCFHESSVTSALNRANFLRRIPMEGWKQRFPYEEKNKNTLISPNEPFTSKKLVRDLFKQLKGDIIICDPYCDIKTFDFLTEIRKEQKIRILTQNNKEIDKLKRDFKDFKKEFSNVSLKIFDKKELHDRYFIADKGYLIGHSIKDLGTKETILSELGEDLKESLLEQFNRRWKVSKEI